MTPKKPSKLRVLIFPKSPTSAARPPSPVTKHTVGKQRKSDEKAANLLGVDRIVVDYTKPIVRRPQQAPEQALLEKERLSLDLPKKDVRRQLYDISERPSLEAESLREELILNDVRFGGALETDPQQRPTFDPSELFDLVNMQIKSDRAQNYRSPRPSSQISDPFYEDDESLISRQSLRSDSLDWPYYEDGDHVDPFTGEGESVKSKKPIEERQPSSSKSKQKAKSTVINDLQRSSIEAVRNSQEVDGLFAEFVDIEALRKIEWKKEGNKFMPSPQERDILIVIRKTLARLLALNMLSRDLQDARGLPLNNFEIPEHFYQVSDQSVLQSVRDAASSFASGYRTKPLCREYDQWAWENGTENLATLAANDCYRQYTEGWQKVFHEYGPWAWNLPDGGQLRALKPK